jgi:Thioredoxin
MAADWDKLAEEWKDHNVGFVAEVDCTAEGKPLCAANNIRGFPTMMFGDPFALQDYQGGRSYAELSKFAMENLKPVCSVANVELCNADMRAQIEKYMKLSAEELTMSMDEKEKKLEKVEEYFKLAIEKLQVEYQELLEAKETTVASVKSAGLTLMKAVLAARVKSEFEPESCDTCDVIV